MSLVKQDLVNGPPIKDWDADGLMHLCDLMYKCEISFKAWNKSHLLNNDEIMLGLFQRLPYRVRAKFVSVSNEGNDSGTFQELRELVELAASEAESVYGKLMTQNKSKSHQLGRPKSLCAAIQQPSKPTPTIQYAQSCVLCESVNELRKCPVFLRQSPQDRKRVVQENKLCYNCLRRGHRVFDCKSKISCRECGGRHHTLLHIKQVTSEVSNRTESEPGGMRSELADDRTSVVSASTSLKKSSKKRDSVKQTIFKIVPVKVWYNDPTKYECTYAFIDEGSSVNLCAADLAKRLRVPINCGNVELQTTNAVTTIKQKVQDLAVQGIEETSAFQIKDALIVDEIVDVNSSIPTNELASPYSHLQDIDFHEIRNGKVELLLGSDLHQAYHLQDLRTGEQGDPSGLRTFLGWTIYGTNGGDQEIQPPKMMVNFLACEVKPEESCEKILEVLSQDFRDIELPERPCLSLEDKRAMEILNKTVEKVGNHYSVGLLWKEDNTVFLNNRKMALKRLDGMKKRFLNNPKFFEDCEKINEYFKCGYAVPVENDSYVWHGRINYIPHHSVSTSSKFRIVFDCSSKFNGKSLNDRLLVGPDLTSNLLAVLLRFRESPIAVVADIKAMFSQVFVDKCDQDAFRFLWYRNDDLSQDPVDCRMQTHVFGARSSPCCAAYALRATAMDNLTNADDLVVRTVFKNIYVDDVCCSCKSVDAAISLVSQLSSLLESGGFHLTKFLSNNDAVLSSVPQEELAREVDLASCTFPAQKALGVYWNPQTDRLMVKVCIKQLSCTRRGVMSMIAQTYDPLGLIQPFLLPAKQILQEACKRVPQLESVSIERSFTLLDKEILGFELHTFSDASISGYGVCVYVKVCYLDGTFKCCFVLGKSRVAPIKSVSAPRLELTAALLAAKTTNFVVNELEIKFSKVFLWTDSTEVLRYLRSTYVRFTAFVANRLQTLHALTAVEQWHYVPSKQNPADIASRGASPDKVDTCNLWFYGPPFLYCDVSEWPKQPSFLPNFKIGDPEVKNTELCFALKQNFQNNALFRLFTRYSNFHDLLRTVVWLLRYRRYLRNKCFKKIDLPPSGSLTALEFEQARLKLVKVVQQKSFPQAFAKLKDQDKFEDPVNFLQESDFRSNKELKELQALNPYLADGILRAGGRLKNAILSNNQKYPITLPKSHPLTDLVVMMHHEEQGHMGTSQVLASLNEEYCIINGRSVINRVINNCMNCRFWKAKPKTQQMGDLPFHRVNKSSPYKSTGTDLMGPLMIRSGRNSLKRYVCIFNCLATRAVHFEVVQSMEASAFIQAYRRFCNRRNVKPTDVYIDNGGNFVAADKKIRKGVKNWQSKQVSDALLQKGASWHFNPPRCSHQGGFYEVFFRLVRKIMRSIVGEATLDEYDLLTLITEIERILNDRPITALPSHPDDLSALTPAMIVTGSVDDSLPPDVFVKADGYKGSWRKTQYLADIFWKKWTCQYLPLLQIRKKWFGTNSNVKPGDLVLVMDESTKSGQWPKALVQDVMPDSNGFVRRVRLRTADAQTLIRDIQKICLLEGSLV